MTRDEKNTDVPNAFFFFFYSVFVSKINGSQNTQPMEFKDSQGAEQNPL